MATKDILKAAVIAAIAFTPATKASADAGNLLGGIAGGIIGGVIVNEATKNRQRTVYRSNVTSATRAANREAQTALNYFGFNAGVVDGVVGRGTRAAMASYQAHMGFPATGNLTPYERDFLVTSYQRAMAGGATTAAMISQNPMGTKGLLITFRDQALGIQQPPPVAAPSVTTTVVVPQQAVPAPAPAVPAPTTTVVVPQPAVPAPAAPATTTASAPAALPNFLGSDNAPAQSLASHCNKVNLLTSTNGGFVTAATMSDPMVALNEQFCLARTYAISEGEDLVAKVQGFSPAQIAAQCDAFGPAMREQVSALSVKPQADVLQTVSSFVLSTGMSPAQLVGTAKICLSVGYRTDNMDVALASALILTALGERAYGELLGHHLAQGFGATQRPDLALAWYETGLEAVENGARQVVAPGQPERTELLRQAAFAIGGRAGGAVPATTQASAPALPTFSVDQ